MDPRKRLQYHNNNLSRYTSGKGSWELVFIQEFENKKDALVREKSLKRSNSSYLLWVIQQPYNIVNQFI